MFFTLTLHVSSVWDNLTCCSTICIWLISFDMWGLLSRWSISIATVSLPLWPMVLAALDLCKTEPGIAAGGRVSTALPWENCSLLSFCCLRFYKKKKHGLTSYKPLAVIGLHNNYYQNCFQAGLFKQRTTILQSCKFPHSYSLNLTMPEKSPNKRQRTHSMFLLFPTILPWLDQWLTPETSQWHVQVVM